MDMSFVPSRSPHQIHLLKLTTNVMLGDGAFGKGT